MAERQVNVKVNVQTGTADKKLGGVNRKLKQTQTQATTTGASLKTAFMGLGGPIAGLIGQFKALGITMKSLPIFALVGAVAGIGKLFVTATKKGAEFAKELSGLEAVSGATNQEMISLSNNAKKLGATTGFSATEVVGLQTEFAKLGFRAKDINNVTKATLDLAMSLDVGLAESASLAGSTLRAFGLQTTETQRVVDVMSASTAQSALDYEGLREAFKNVAPAAKATNRSIEETTALLAVMANNGVKGSKAGTGLKNAFIELNKKGLGLNEALDQIGTSSDKLGTAMKIAGKIGGQALLTLAANKDDIENLTLSFENSAGAAAQLAETRFDNLAGDVISLESAWEGFLLSIEDGTGIFNSIARGIVQATTALVSFITPSTKVTDELKNQRIELFKTEAEIDRLDKTLKDTTLSEEELEKAQQKRVQIILKLKEEYPDYLGDIEAETATTEELKKAIDAVSESLINKIIIQEKEEEILEQAEEAAEARRKFLEMEERILTRTAELRAEYEELKFDIQATDTAGFIEEMNRLRQEQVDLRNEGNETAKTTRKQNSQIADDLRRLESGYKLLKKAEEEYNEELNATNELTAEKDALLKKLGISIEETTEAQDDNNDSEGEAIEQKRDLLEIAEEELKLAKQMPGTTKKEIAERNDAIKAVNAKIKALKELTLIEKERNKFADLQIPKIVSRNAQEIETTKLHKENLLNITKRAEEQMANEVIKNRLKIRTFNEQLEEEEEQRLINNQIRNQQRMMQQMDFTARTLGAIIDLTQALAKDDEASQRKSFNIRKAAGIAQAIINTGLAVTAALTAGGNPIKLATGAQFVEAGIAAVTGAAQVATIARQQFESTSSNVPPVGGTGGGLGDVQSQAPQFNIVGNSAFNQIAGALNQPIQAYVVAQDVTTAQQLDNGIITSATLGGG